MRTHLPLALIAATFACSQFACPAHATARDRVFVASYGNDSNPCTFLSPCKTFQQAVNIVAAGGEVTAIDSAGFGPISITQSVTITSPDGVEAGIVPTTSGDAITINATSAVTVVLRGLTLNGSSVGANGIVFEGGGGGSLTVDNCVVQNFVGSGPNAGVGIVLEPSAGTLNFVITNTKILNNSYSGFFYLPVNSPSISTNGVIDHVVAMGDDFAISINAESTSAVIAVSNSVISNNLADGVIISGSPTVSIDNDTISSNGNHGVEADGTSTVFIGRSVITGNGALENGAGVIDSTSGNTVYTYGDNRINGNTHDVVGTLSTTFTTR